MRTRVLILFFTVSLSVAYLNCSRNEVVEPAVPKGTAFELTASDYATNYFFVDTSYLRLYEPFFQNTAPIITDPAKQIVEIEVWQSFYGNNWVDLLNSIQGIAHISLPERHNGYDSILRQSIPVDGRIEGARFARLDSRHFELIGDGLLGLVAFRTLINDNQILAVAYRTADGKQFGEFSRNFSPADTNVTRILKLIKPKNLIVVGPIYNFAWKLMLKSVYQIGVMDVSKNDFSFDVWRRSSGIEDATDLMGHRTLRVMGLDRYNSVGVPVPDGDNVFDFLPGHTINPQYGEIILPSLRPFDTGIRKYFQERGVSLSDSSEFLCSAAYDTTKTEARRHYTNRYFLRGRARTRE
ncbi:MAG: hypothetical protein HY961_15675 [Ignavibacteriae bacterium]|nr:hypothetical protein [Ignavibacteriota bacterium]